MDLDSLLSTAATGPYNEHIKWWWFGCMVVGFVVFVMAVPAAAKEEGLPWKVKAVVCFALWAEGARPIIDWLVLNVCMGYDGFSLSHQYEVIWFVTPGLYEWSLLAGSVGMFLVFAYDMDKQAKAQAQAQAQAEYDKAQEAEEERERLRAVLREEREIGDRQRTPSDVPNPPNTIH